MSLRHVAVPFLLAATLAAPAAAETLRVPKDFATLQAAAQAAAPGDVVLLSSGSYEQTGLKDVEGLTIRAKGKVVFRAPGAKATTSGLTLVDCRDMVVDGLRFEGLDEGVRVLDSQRIVLRDLRLDACDVGVSLDDADLIVMDGLRMADGGDFGVEINESADVTVSASRIEVAGIGILAQETPRILVRGSRIEADTGLWIANASDSDVVANDIRGHDTGIVMFGPRSTIRDNRIHDGVLGLRTALGSTQVGSKILGNRIWNCSGDGVLSWNLAAEVTDNTIWNVGGVGLEVGASGQRVTGNTIRKAGGAGLRLTESGTTVVGNRIQKAAGGALVDEAGDQLFVDNVPPLGG